MCGGVAVIHGLYYDFGWAALKDGLYTQKTRKSRFLGQTAPFGMTMFRLIAY
jgi:hypothetical protein